MFKFKMKMLPVQYINYFKKKCQVYQKFTKACLDNNYFISRLKTSKTQRSIKYHGPLIWNSVNANLKSVKFQTFLNVN